MRILGPVVLPATKIMVLGKAQILQSSTLRWQFVCDEDIGDKALSFQQLAHQLEGIVRLNLLVRLSLSPFLDFSA